MSISILNRGASGGLKPELTVIAPAGSTIDILRNGVIIATRILGASETACTFVVGIGVYTVRGTLGTKTESAEVIIDVVSQYKVAIVYKTWLYREGDEHTSITGGWSSPSVKSGYNWDCKNTADATRTAVKNSDNLQVEMALAANTGSAYAAASFWTVKQIDLTGISAIKCDIYVTNSVCTLAVNQSNPLTTTISILNALSKSVGATTVGERSIVTLDVSDLTGAYCVGFFVAHYTRSKVAQGGKIYNVWLE